MGGRKAHGFFFGMNMNIVLIGYRCTGKSSIGKLLESELEKRFVDTDEMIEDEANCGIDEIVGKKGWDFFRSLEKRTAVQENPETLQEAFNLGLKAVQS